MAGRREAPVDPAAGPVQRFASELRELRAEAGGLTYRALARRAGYSVTTLSRAAAGEQLPTLPVALAYVRACGGDEERWQARWQEAVERSAADGARDDDGSPTPYRGLARFETADSALFFGREELTADLVGLLRRRRFAAVFGPSGSGKSSLLRAGLIPVLQQTREPGARPAAIRILTPGEHPARTHAAALIPAPPDDSGAEADTYIVVDQFEEVFTLCHDPAERARFIDLLLAARRPESRLRVLLAVRGDFYGRCAEHRELADALREANLLAGAMSPAELRDAVVKPATAAGLTVERALTARLVEEVAAAPGGLPLLSHALLETWLRRRGKTLTMAGYEAAGCLDGAIAKTAEEVYGRFTEAQKTAARRVLLRLIAPGDGTPDTRRPVDRAELPGIDRHDTAHVLEALTRARLLTLDGDTVDMAHEALITAWPRLRDWIDEDRERLRTHRHLTEAAHAWHQLGREEGALYRGSRLSTAEEHFADAPQSDLTDLAHLTDLTDLEYAFLGASRAHDQRGRRRHRLVLTAVLTTLCLALVAAGLAVGQRQNAVTAQQEAQSRQLAAQSGALLDTDPDLAALLAVHAYRTSPTREATTALYTAAELPLRKRLISGTQPVDALALSPDGHTLAVGSRDGALRIRNMPDGRILRTFTVQGLLEPLEFSPDGRTLAVATTEGLDLWDPATGRKRGTLAIRDGAVRGLDFSPDGRTVAVASVSAVRVWDVATGRIRYRFAYPDPELVAFGPDGRTVAVTGIDGVLRVRDLATGRVRIARDSRSEGTVVSFSPDGRLYVVALADGSVRLREVATGVVRRTLRGSLDRVTEVAFAPDGRSLAAPGAGDTVRVWDTATGRALTTLTAGHRGHGINAMALGGDGRTLVTSGHMDPVVRVQRLSLDRPRTSFSGPADASVADMAFGPDGRTVAAVHQGWTGGGVAQLWDARSGEREAVLPLDAAELPWPVNHPEAVGFGPTGRALAARVTEGGVLEVRDVATGRLRQSRAVKFVGTIVFSRDGTQLAVVGGDGTVRIWNLSTGTLTTVRNDHERPVRSAEFAPDGRTLAVVAVASNGDDEVELIDTATGRARATVEPGTGFLGSLALGRDGRTLVTLGHGGSVKVWEVRTGRFRDGFSTGSEVASSALSPDGRTLAVGGARGVQLWDLATGRIRATLPGPAHARVSFGPDGHVLVVGAGGSVALWDVDLPDLAHAVRGVCEAVGRDLTPGERSRYLGDQSAGTGCGEAAR
ncbi:helix-turn-helix domain-containing protein [Streptomyces sp. SID13726]|uniref:nSTAND1 domain-containing NTPase n=1 Tax=Streptomyces sp. SID13726 TaxID=2706058 RepID=UPI0013BC5861|nr:helix-turn-helix domain-containing protein [Streptomyces sp. SID13726]